jgi:hypothetical protein
MRQGPFPPGGCVVPPITGTTAPSDAHPASVRLPVCAVIRTASSRLAEPGPGRASPVPVPTFRPSRSPYPGGFLGAAVQGLCAVRGLRRSFSGSAPPVPCGLTSRGCRIRLMLRAGRLLASHRRDFDAALRRRRFPFSAGSLLPGSLATTRTGLAPAGGHKLSAGHLIASPLSIPMPADAGHTKERVRLRRRWPMR